MDLVIRYLIAADHCELQLLKEGNEQKREAWIKHAARYRRLAAAKTELMLQAHEVMLKLLRDDPDASAST